MGPGAFNRQPGAPEPLTDNKGTPKPLPDNQEALGL